MKTFLLDNGAFKIKASIDDNDCGQYFNAILKD